MTTMTPVTPEPPRTDAASAIPLRALPVFIPVFGALLLLLTGLVWAIVL